MKKHIRNWILMGIALAGTLGAEPVRVGTSVLPQAWIVQQIGGEWVEVRALQTQGDSCGIFEARPQTLAWFSEALIYFRTGVAFEGALMERFAASFPNLQVVDLRENLNVAKAAKHAHAHTHAAHGECAGCGAEHGAADTTPTLVDDPHIWMDPVLVKAQAKTIRDALERVLPAAAQADIDANYREFVGKVEALDAELAAAFAGLERRAFYVYHPALGYLAQRYGLEQVAIASGGDPSARELRGIMAAARQAGVGAILVQPQESQRHAHIVAEAIGAGLIEIDPLALEWLPNLRAMGLQLAQSLADEAGE